MGPVGEVELRGRVGLSALAAAIRELVITTDPLLVSCCCKKEGISPLLQAWCGGYN